MNKTKIKAVFFLFFLLSCCLLFSFEIVGSAETNSLKRAEDKAIRDFHINIGKYIIKRISDVFMFEKDFVSYLNLSSNFWNKVDEIASKESIGFSLSKVNISVKNVVLDEIILNEIENISFDKNNQIKLEIHECLLKIFSNEDVDFSNKIEFVFPSKTFTDNPKYLFLFNENEVFEENIFFRKDGDFLIPDLNTSTMQKDIISIIYIKLIEDKLKKIKIEKNQFDNSIKLKTEFGIEETIAFLLGFSPSESGIFDLEITDNMETGKNNFGNTFCRGKGKIIIKKQNEIILKFETDEMKEISKADEENLKTRMKIKIADDLRNKVEEYRLKCLGNQN